jgi:hypothetical protein
MSPGGRTLLTVSEQDQLSLFAPAMVGPELADLQGLLAGPGQAVRRQGTARLSVIVAEQWRVDALLGEFADRGLAGDQVPADGEGIAVRTEFSRSLAPLAGRWLNGAVKSPPAGFALGGASLRLWALAAGVPAGTVAGYLLRLGPTDEPAWSKSGAALAAAALPATFVGVRAGGPGYRITGRRRLTRLRELIGEPPPGADQWLRL